MATYEEFMGLQESLLTGPLAEEIWISKAIPFGNLLRARKGKSTTKNIEQLGKVFTDDAENKLNQLFAEAISSTFADLYDGQTNVAIGIVIAIPPSTTRHGDIDNYANSVLDMTVQLFKKVGPFIPGSGKVWDDKQIKDLRVLRVKSWDDNWYVAISSATSKAPS